MEKEVQLLSRVSVNYLFLAQFETFRASLLSLRNRDSDLAVAILRAVVAEGGRFKGVLWSKSVNSPPHFAWLSALELIEYGSYLSSKSKVDPELLKLKAEFLLILQMISSEVSESYGKFIDLDSIGGQDISIYESYESRPEDLAEFQGSESNLSEPTGFMVDVAALLDKLFNLGFQRLKREVVFENGLKDLNFSFTDGELKCLRRVICDQADLLDSLCLNIWKQMHYLDGYESKLALSLHRGELSERTDNVVGDDNDFDGLDQFLLGSMIQREFQSVHLELLKKEVKDSDIDENFILSRLRFLHLEYGLSVSEYRMVLQDCIEKFASFENGYGETWFSVREKMLKIYGETLSSNCLQLVQMIQAIQDDLLSKEIELYRLSNADLAPPPLQKLQKYFDALSCTEDSVQSMVIRSCKQDMYHYARVTGVHVLETIMDAALSSLKREELRYAANVLVLFPLLQPLVAVMGWDLLPGKTAARRKLMVLLWTSKSQMLRLGESSLYRKQSEEISCVEHLCNILCYRLDLAFFAECVNSGRPWNSKTSLRLSGKELMGDGAEDMHMDPFVANFVLERLAVQTPLRVLFDTVPTIKFQDAIELISMQPIASTSAAWKRIQDLELVHMRFALQSAVLALGALERCMIDKDEKYDNLAIWYLKDLQDHLEAINNIPRKICMVSVIISLLHMDDLSANLTQYISLVGRSELPRTPTWEQPVFDGETRTVVSFIGLILDILRHNLPSNGLEIDPNSWSNATIASGKQAMEWRISSAVQFIEDWEWRLSILQRLLPLSERHWSWKEALAILRAAPSKLLNVCMQRAKYDIGEEAVHRFSLPPEDKAALELVEWVDGAFRKASVEDVVSRVAEGIPGGDHELDFSSFCSQLGPLATVLLCIDVAATTAKSVHMCSQLLHQAQTLLSQIFPGGAPKKGSTYWDQVQEACIITVTRRVLKRLHDFLDQSKFPSLQAILRGDMVVSPSSESNRQGQRQRALAILHQMIEDAHKGKRQFLSGKLHNLVKAVADEEMDESSSKESSYVESTVSLGSEKDGILGLGLRTVKSNSHSTAAVESSTDPTDYDLKDVNKRLYGPLSSKPATYLSAFILYIATIGDIVDGVDTTHDFNFFSLIYEWPKDLLTRLVFERGSADAAGKVADIMGADLVHEVISACVPPVFPPRSGHGWACIPVLPAYPMMSLENKIHSHSSVEAQPSSSSSLIPGVPLYPLQLNIVKHLATLSPVRAVLACVFGSTILSSGSESLGSSSSHGSITQPSDADRLFYEFALDQSYRYPTLNRWIQMQSNLHRVTESAIITKRMAETGKSTAGSKTLVKRLREPDSDTESEVEDDGYGAVGAHASVSVSEFDKKEFAASGTKQDLQRSESFDSDRTVFLSFDWENEGPYEEAVERLINDGKLMDALALSDRCLRNGASDRLLQLLVERGEENMSASGLPVYGGHNFGSNSWQYCLRLKDKRLAATLALKYVHRWELDAALDVLTMCSCHLTADDPLKTEVMQMRQALQRYNHIWCSDDQYSSWQEVEADCKEDPEGLALRLAGKGAVSAALEVAESASLSIDLRRELQGRQLVKLLTADPVNGGGPAEASRFLSSLRDSDDALPVAMGAMQQLPSLRSKQLLVHFFLKRRAGNLSDVEISRLNSWALGLRVLAVLPLPWQQRCSSLHEHPHLILEVLLMRKQLQSASLILKEFPSLCDNDLILKYSAKAIAVNVTPPLGEQRYRIAASKTKQRGRSGVPPKSNIGNSLSNLQREARRAFSWAPRDTGNKVAPKETQKKRKSSGFSPSERATWEAMAGIQEDRVSFHSGDSQERLPSIATAEGWILTGDPSKDDAVRMSHQYESAPDIILFEALLSLCSDELVSAKGALELCITQMRNVLSSQQLPLHSSMEKVGRAYHATETFVQALVHARSHLRKLVGSSDLSSTSDRSREADDVSSDAGSSSISSQCTDELSELVSQADIWLGRAELLQSLLGSGIVASLDDIADKESSAHLRDRLIGDERYSMAVYTCKKCKIDTFPVWSAWGHALNRMEHYAQARVKFKQALQLHKGDPAPVIIEIINTMESGPPVDVSSVRSMYEHLAKSAPTILDDSLSADSYLNVLYMPSTFPRSERSRRSQEATNSHAVLSNSVNFEDGPRSNLDNDNIRYVECINYLQEYARQEMLSFMFRHGHYVDACLLFFPPNAIPVPAQPSAHGTATQSSSPQRPDPLGTDYGTIEDLCDLCVGYGAMFVLENVIGTRNASAASHEAVVSHYTAAALTRICNYCETHRHFNFLYKFQVLKKDHVAAGLCCVQLFMNSASQEEALRHLEHAKMHFVEGLSARHKAGESTKLISKGVRGKSASEKLTEEGLVKFSARVAIQMDVVRSFNESDGPPWKHSLFGNPNDPETFRRRCEVAETLAERNFDLACQVIYEFNLPAVHIYAGVAASLAERKKGNQLTEFFRYIKGTIEDDDWDQVLGAAINVYANRHRERPDRLIDMLSSSHRKVLACVVCGRLKSAFQIASRSGSVADVQYVAHQALQTNALPVLDMCKQWLAQYM
ncbi:uncharacterized protein LOC18432072 [Amborella trichopoda]|uniref:uncharacterized protein LOC18432072 n=1 Tax=Amborella trichopoda TaxID=13333 RepID=UPI0005D442A1|nr:uncharacterized protein LOC18432072 [Amborella trichopoda]|eukprot:XP_011622545.1 uncharacterized protein LOC18432072 [Amborella trichopoda]